MPGSSRDGEPGIGLSRLQWTWLLLNLVWVHSLLPGIVLHIVSVFRDPAAGVLERFGSAAVLIVGVPFLLVVGFGMATWGALERLAALRRPVRRATERE